MCKSLTILALLNSLCVSASADDFKGDNSACWDKPLKRLTGGKRVVWGCQVTLTGGGAALSTTDRRRCALSHLFAHSGSIVQVVKKSTNRWRRQWVGSRR